MANYLVITIILLILLVSTFLWHVIGKRIWRKKRIWNHLKDLYEVYDKGCQNVTVQKWEKKTERTMSVESWVNGVYIRNGFCCALGDIIEDYYIKRAVIGILASYITLSDLDWRLMTKDANTVTLEAIQNGHGEGMYWFIPGDVISRRNFLRRVLVMNHKMK